MTWRLGDDVLAGRSAPRRASRVSARARRPSRLQGRNHRRSRILHWSAELPLPAHRPGVSHHRPQHCALHAGHCPFQAGTGPRACADPEPAIRWVSLLAIGAALAVRCPDGPLGVRVVVDPRSAVQLHQLGAGEARRAGPQRELPRQLLPRARLADGGEHLARHSVLHCRLPRRSAGHSQGTARGGRHRWRGRLADLLADHLDPPAPAHHYPHHLLGDLHLHRFPAHLDDYPRRPGQRDAPLRHAGLSARHSGRSDGRRRGDRGVHASILGAARLGRARRAADAGMRRAFSLWLPLLAFALFLLFPFYWMVLTSIKPNSELVSVTANPFWVSHPTLDHIKFLLSRTSYPRWFWNTMAVAAGATALSVPVSFFAAFALARVRFRGAEGVRTFRSATMSCCRRRAFSATSSMRRRTRTAASPETNRRRSITCQVLHGPRADGICSQDGCRWSRPPRRPGRAGPEAGSGGPGGHAPNGSMEHGGDGSGQRCRQVTRRGRRTQDGHVKLVNRRSRRARYVALRVVRRVPTR